MRRIAIVTCFGLAAIGSAQTIQNVYNRDTEEKFKLKHVKVERTAPDGKAEFRRINGRLVLDMRAEAGLSSVTTWLANGEKLTLIEIEPGLCRLDMPSERPTVMLTDGASNKRMLTCSWFR